jgi:hypothetical protein
MPRGFEVVDVPPDLQPLYRALDECSIKYHLVPLIAARLSKPPESFHIPRPDNTAITNSLIQSLVGFDEDVAAHMLRLNEAQPSTEVKWRDLSSAERKRAKRLWNWTVDAGLDTAPQGRLRKLTAHSCSIVRDFCQRRVANPDSSSHAHQAAAIQAVQCGEPLWPPYHWQSCS